MSSDAIVQFRIHGISSCFLTENDLKNLMSLELLLRPQRLPSESLVEIAGVKRKFIYQNASVMSVCNM